MRVRPPIPVLLVLAALVCAITTASASLYDSATVYYDFTGLTVAQLNSTGISDRGSAGIDLVVNNGAPSITAGPSAGVDAILLSTGDSLVPASSGEGAALDTAMGTPFTMSTWIKRSGDSNDFTFATKMLANTGGDDAYRGWWFRLRNDGTLDVIWRYANDASQRLYLRSAALIPDGDSNFHHLATTFDFDMSDGEYGFRIYLDGVEQTDTLTLAISSDTPNGLDWNLDNDAPFTLNGRAGSPDQEGGYLAQFAVWNGTALSSQNIEELAGVPEPVSLGLLGLGGLVVLIRRDH